MSFMERMDRQMNSMSSMIEKVGVDLDRLAMSRLGLDLADAIRACRACAAADECAEWLKQAPAHLDHAPGFCPNAARFERLKAQ